MQITLAWDAPSLGIDENILNDLAGFKILYGTTSGVYTTIIDVGNVNTYDIFGLLANTYYYFVVTAYDTEGNESDFSSELIEMATAGGGPSPSYMRSAVNQKSKARSIRYKRRF